MREGRNVIDQMGMLQDYNGSSVSVVTAVTLGSSTLLPYILSTDDEVQSNLRSPPQVCSSFSSTEEKTNLSPSTQAIHFNPS
jgi:hypothetical protein